VHKDWYQLVVESEYKFRPYLTLIEEWGDYCKLVWKYRDKDGEIQSETVGCPRSKANKVREMAKELRKGGHSELKAYHFSKGHNIGKKEERDEGGSSEDGPSQPSLPGFSSTKARMIKGAYDESFKKALMEELKKFVDSTGDNWNYLLPTDLKKAKKGKYFLLDVRRPENFAEGHIPGAKNIFWLDLLKPENLKKLPRDKKIVVICYVGHTASQAMVILKLLGYDAVGLKYGMGISPVEGIPVAGWVDYGYETTGD